MISLFQAFLSVLILAQIGGCSVVGTVDKSLEHRSCEPNTKLSQDGTNCESLSNYDVLRAINLLAKPPQSDCKKKSTVQGLTICEDDIDTSDCVIWSFIASNWCDHYGSLAFEKYWSKKGCKVSVYHYHMKFKGNQCADPDGSLDGYPNIQFIRGDMWAANCYSCFYTLASKDLPSTPRIDILKIQGREGVNEDLEGTQFVALADLFQHMPNISSVANQITLTVSLNTQSLTDHVGREAGHAWNMWGSQQLLRKYAAIASDVEPGPSKLLPLQYAHMLNQAHLPETIGTYRHTFKRVTDASSQLTAQELVYNNWQPAPPQYKLRAQVPAYCRPPPSAEEDKKLQAWTWQEMNTRCHPTRLHVPCDRSRNYDAFIPCPQEALNYLAEDYAAMKGWCSFTQPEAAIQPLGKVDKLAAKAFQQPPISGPSGGDKQRRSSTRSSSSSIVAAGGGDGSSSVTGSTGSAGDGNVATAAAGALTATPTDLGSTGVADMNTRKWRGRVRLAFFFTVYHDAGHVTRLLQRLYSPTHYYLIHLDASHLGVSSEFEREMRLLSGNYSNVFLCKDVPIVYGASTATILLTRAMAWFHKYATGWDYFIPLTGSDYPLLPLPRIEEIFAFQNPPMPFVMAWTPGTSTHMFRLQKTHPIFETDPLIVKSIKAVTDERGKVLGAVPMEFRSNNFGPPVFCNNRSSFVHFDNRQNKSARIFDTQWLFPRDVFRGRGRAQAEESPQYSTPSFDGQWRVWKKSDPATTGAYDKVSVAYIVDSEEGKKYWHFFKHMLLGSEEHYYISLLYNWPRTKAFVQSLSSEIVWNTWEIGLWERSDGGFQTHTHFLSLDEWDIIRGFAKRGMMFARKFSSKKTAALLDRIDEHLLLNSSTDAGLYWPGFYKVDTTTPGREWVANYRRTMRLKREAEIKAKRGAMKLKKSLQELRDGGGMGSGKGKASITM